MRTLTGHWWEWTPLSGAASVTIGVLDGLHRGHRALLQMLDEEAVTTVLTFEPHPVEVLRPGTAPRLITTIEERLELLNGAGVDQVGVLDLTEIRDLTPGEFVETILVQTLGVSSLVIGADFRFGRDRSGDVAMLRDLGDRHGYRVDVAELVADESGVISSSRIRGLIEIGRVAEAARLLESRYRLTSVVVEGDRRGRELGFPTANLVPPQRKVLPGTGIYACFAKVRGKIHEAAVSVGVRPTFGQGELLVEAYLLDFDDDIYGETLTLEFVDYLRPELRFEEVQSLIERMNADVAKTGETLRPLVSDMS